MPQQDEERGTNFLPDFRMATALVISQQDRTHRSAHRSMLQWSNKVFAANTIPKHGGCQHEPKAVLMVKGCWIERWKWLPCHTEGPDLNLLVLLCTWKISISLAQQGYLPHSNIPFFFPAEICYPCQPPGLVSVGSSHSFLNFPRDCGTELLTSASSLDQHHLLLLLFHWHPYCLQGSIQLPCVSLLCPHWHLVCSSRPHMWCCAPSLAADNGISPRTAMICALDPVGLQHQNTPTGSLLQWQWEAIGKCWHFMLGRRAENQTSSLTIAISWKLFYNFTISYELFKLLFMVMVTEHWKRLPREVVESPSMEIFKTQLDAYLCHLL